MEVRDKSTGNLLREVRENTRSEAEDTIGKGLVACDDLDSLPVDELAKGLLSISDAILNNTDSLSRTISVETGMAIIRSREDLHMASQEFRMAAYHLFSKFTERTTIPVEPNDASLMTFHKQSPLGIILVFSSPLESFSHSAKVFAQAISSGNSVISVPPSLSPGPFEEMKKIIEHTTLPKDIFQILLLGNHSRVFRDVIRNEGIGEVTLIGRRTDFEYICKEISGRNVLLGGKSASPVIVWDDADLDSAAQYVAESAFYNHEGGYSWARKVILREDSYEYFKNRLVELASQLKTGTPEDEDTAIGPLPDELYAEEAAEQILEAVNKGASILTGGVGNGNLFPPTIMEYMPEDSPLLRGEGCAPFLCLEQVGSLDEAIKSANRFHEHVQASIFTSDIDLATGAAEKLHFANVLINEAPGPYSGFWHRGLENAHNMPENIVDLRREFSRTKIVKLKK